MQKKKKRKRQFNKTKYVSQWTFFIAAKCLLQIISTPTRKTEMWIFCPHTPKKKSSNIWDNLIISA